MITMMTGWAVKAMVQTDKKEPAEYTFILMHEGLPTEAIVMDACAEAGTPCVDILSVQRSVPLAVASKDVATP